MFWDVLSIYHIYIYISVPINPLALSFPNSSEDESDSFLRPLGDGSTNAGNVFSNLATSWSFRCTTSSVRFGSQLGNIRLNQWHKVDQSRSMCFFCFYGVLHNGNWMKLWDLHLTFDQPKISPSAMPKAQSPRRYLGPEKQHQRQRSLQPYTLW